MPDRDWKLVASAPVSDHRIFRLRHDRYRLAPGDEERDFVVMEAGDWINVIPVTSDGHVVFIRQFRHGVRRVTLEVPGGMVDPGESPERAALRELREETGYAARAVRPLGFVWPNPAIQDNRCHSFLAEDVQFAGDPHPEPFERIEVELHPLSDVPRLLREGQIRHALVVAAFAHLGVTAKR